jgi:hypothetical protein
VTKVLIVAIATLLLSACASSSRLDRNVTTGALIGGGAGAVVGGLSRGTLGGAVAGGVIGAVAGGVIGALITRNGRCYVRTSSGRLLRVRCP